MGEELGRVSTGQVHFYDVTQVLLLSLYLASLVHIVFRVDSWMTFKGKTPYGQQKAEKVKKAKKAKFSPIGFRPPKPKPEQRM